MHTQHAKEEKGGKARRRLSKEHKNRNRDVAVCASVASPFELADSDFLGEEAVWLSTIALSFVTKERPNYDATASLPHSDSLVPGKVYHTYIYTQLHVSFL